MDMTEWQMCRDSRVPVAMASGVVRFRVAEVIAHSGMEIRQVKVICSWFYEKVNVVWCFVKEEGDAESADMTAGLVKQGRHDKFSRNAPITFGKSMRKPNCFGVVATYFLGFEKHFVDKACTIHNEGHVQAKVVEFLVTVHVSTTLLMEIFFIG